jgi:hypothetical protein
MDPRSSLPGHEVTNQPPARGDRDLWADDPVLRTHGADVGDHARALGTVQAAGWARDANTRLPELRAFDAGGRRLDEVGFTDGYHRLMALGLSAGYAAAPWTGGSHLEHATMVYLHSQVEPGTCCPLTMTYAAVPALAAAPDLAALWVPKLTARDYDPSVAPVAVKRAATLGMAMTEKQGGSDVRTNSHAGRTGRRGVAADRAQVVLLRPHVRRVPDARADRGRSLLLPRPTLAARRHAQRHPPDAAEGQAREPRQCLGRDRVSRRAGASGGGGGARYTGDPDDGASHASRHGACACGPDARRARSPRPLGQAPHRLPAAAGRSAAHAVASGGSGARLGGRGGARLPRRAGLRRSRPRALRPDRRGAGEIPQQQACPPRDHGGDGGPRRHGLRGGHTPADALPGGAAERHLGRLGQRDLPRHPADAGKGTGSGRAAGRRSRRGQGGPALRRRAGKRIAPAGRECRRRGRRAGSPNAPRFCSPPPS